MNVRVARAEDVETLKDNLRSEDAQEILAAGYPSTHAALADSFAKSAERFTVELDGVPVAMFGLVSSGTLLGGEDANIWFLGSPAMAKIKKSFVKLSARYTQGWLDKFPVLWNVVDARYASSIAWLKSIGAEFAAWPMQLNGHEFYFFSIRRTA